MINTVMTQSERGKTRVTFLAIGFDFALLIGLKGRVAILIG